MKRIAAAVVPSFGFVCSIFIVTSVQAIAPRAYVSVNGNDANTCSNPATPCRTFTGAIAQVTSGGEVVVLDSGTFGGGTISQAVTINAPAGVAALAATPIIINAGASDVVTLRGITFVSPSPGTGIALTFNGGAGLNVEQCTFHGWNNGISVLAAGKLNVADTTVRDSASAGIYLHASSGTIQASFERVRLLGNYNGLYVDSGANATIKNSLAAGSGNTGLLALSFDALNSELSIEDCVSTNNATGVGATSFSTGFGTVRISTSTITNNLTGLYQASLGVLVSRVNNTVEGNSSDTSGTIGSFTAR
jgi:hypothetical protein